MMETLPQFERPRERCLVSGAATLSLRECLALILGSGPPGVGCLGLAQQILENPGKGLEPSEEERAFFTSMEGPGATCLREISGLGPAGIAKILAAFEVGRRYSHYRGRRREQNSLPRSSAADLAIEVLKKISQKNRTEPQEWLGFVPIHRTGEVGDLCFVERGVRTHVNLDPSELFARILALRPRGFYLFHNHPSGIEAPSIQDLDLTERVADLSARLGIALMGHWIVTPTSEYWIMAKEVRP